MCAIAGILNLQAPEAVVTAMRQTMHRRGPDDFGVFRGENVTLLHARLAVIDIEGGQQPMSLFYEGEEYTIVYNGELYNTRELRCQLQKLGQIQQVLRSVQRHFLLRTYQLFQYQ